MDMRSLKLLVAVGIVVSGAVMACGGEVVVGEQQSGASAEDAGSAADDDAGAGSAATSTKPTKDASSDTSPVDSGCATPVAGVVVAPGGAIPPPTGHVAMQLTFVYQGASVYITRVGARDVAPVGDSTRPQPGVNSGYWVSVHDASDAVLFTQSFFDPTVQEGFGGDGGFSNSTLPVCDPKSFIVDVPNDAAARAVVVYGSPYGTQNVATEIGRFTLP